MHSECTTAQCCSLSRSGPGCSYAAAPHRLTCSLHPAGLLRCRLQEVRLPLRSEGLLPGTEASCARTHLYPVCAWPCFGSSGCTRQCTVFWRIQCRTAERGPGRGSHYPVCWLGAPVQNLTRGLGPLSALASPRPHVSSSTSLPLWP